MTDTKKNIIRKILVKLLVLLVILVALDVVYYFTLYPKDLEEQTTMMEISQRAKKGIDIVYLGESSNFSYAESDTDHRYICMMIDDSLPGHHVGNLSKGACHAGIYYDIMHNIPRNNDVKTAIVTVNMRSFTSEWLHSDLETPLRKEQIMIKKYPALCKRMLLAFKAYPVWTEKERAALIRKGFIKQTFTLPHPFPYQNAYEWDRAVGISCILYDGSQPSIDSVALACHHIKHFACELDDKNTRIKDLDRIVKLCKRRGWQPVFNILAENVDQIDSLCGPDLLYLLEQNVQYVTDRYESQGVIVVNNLREVRDKDFFDRDFPTEHYAQTGRSAIAKNVTKTIANRLP
jgi:hypothetical protein